MRGVPSAVVRKFRRVIRILLVDQGWGVWASASPIAPKVLAKAIRFVDAPHLGLHESDFKKLIASGLCFGFGFGMLFGGRKFLGE